MNVCNYGFIFNEIIIKDDIFTKKFKNYYGKQKINNEIEFYFFLSNNKILFSTPQLIEFDDGILQLEYIKNANTLTNIINKENMNMYITKIINLLKNIHNIKKKISNTLIIKDIENEVETKIVNRYNSFDWCNNSKFNEIHSVNNIKINNINYYIDLIKNKLIVYFKERNYYNLIHGDTHLGNIILDNDKNILFIDPRGYFGNSKLFGLYEYDYAKLMFGLSGYSIFDEMVIDELQIKNNNLDIEFIKNYEHIFNSELFSKETSLLCLSIWLGNNSCFLDNNKKITSLMIALYYCEKFISKF